MFLPWDDSKPLEAGGAFQGEVQEKLAEALLQRALDEEALIHSKPGIFLVDSGHVK